MLNSSQAAPIIDPQDWDINQHLPLEEKEKYLNFLYDRRAAFATTAIDQSIALPAAPNVTHTINLTDPTPIKQPPYRQSPFKQDFIRKTICELTRLNLIRPSASAWSSSVVVVPKKDGTMRMCIDYRRLNAVTKKDAYPIPLIDDCLQMAQRAKWYTLIDVKDAYWRIAMDEESIPYTAFSTADGLYEWTRMPFGVTNGPATFQRYIDYTLRDYIGKCCVAFFDDVLVYSSGNHEEHRQDIEKVLAKLYAAGLPCKSKKCKIAYDQVIFIGHLIGHGTIAPDPDKIRAVQDFPTPKNVTEVRSFLGLANYYRRFIPGFARIALPLYELTKKHQIFEWSGLAQAAFTRLKQALSEAPCLQAPDFSKPFILQTDASGEGIAAVLVQLDNEGTEHPIAYVSRKYNPAESRYSATEQECLAIVYGINQFETYLIDKPFTIVTDHQALKYLNSKKSQNSRLTRWAIRLAEFNFTVQHRPGTSNANADALSRCPLDEAPSEPELPDPRSVPMRIPFNPHRVMLVAAARRRQQPESDAPLIERNIHDYKLYHLSDEESYQNIAKEQSEDPIFATIITYLSKREVPAYFSTSQRANLERKAEAFALDHSTKPPTLYYYPKSSRTPLSQFLPMLPRLVIPQPHRSYLIQLYHDSPFGGHMGISRTWKRISNLYWWPSMFQDIVQHIGECQSCQMNKARRQKPTLPQGHIRPADAPFELVSMDYVGPWDMIRDYRYLLVSIDHFTGWVIAIPTSRNDTGTAVSILLNEIIYKYGCPKRLLTDQGPAFESQLFRAFCYEYRIQKLRSSTYYPQANGKVERAIGTLKSIIRNYVLSNKHSWVETIAPAAFAFNCSPNEATGLSPYTSLFHREPRHPFAPDLPEDVLPEDRDEAASHVAYQAKQIQDYIQAVLKSRADQIESRNRELPRYPTYKPGDLVYVEDYRTRGRRGPFVPYFLGPYAVVERLGTLTYIIRPLDASRKETETIHVKKLKPFRKRQPPEQPPEHLPSLEEEPPFIPEEEVQGRPNLPLISPPPLVEENEEIQILDNIPHEREEEDELEEKYPSALPSPEEPPSPQYWVRPRHPLVPKRIPPPSPPQEEPIRARLRPRQQWRINYNENVRDFQLPEDTYRLHGSSRH